MIKQILALNENGVLFLMIKNKMSKIFRMRLFYYVIGILFIFIQVVEKLLLSKKGLGFCCEGVFWEGVGGGVG